MSLEGERAGVCSTGLESADMAMPLTRLSADVDGRHARFSTARHSSVHVAAVALYRIPASTSASRSKFSSLAGTTNALTLAQVSAVSCRIHHVMCVPPFRSSKAIVIS